jgi:hypothetical protein
MSRALDESMVTKDEARRDAYFWAGDAYRDHGHVHNECLAIVGIGLD